MRGLAVLRYLFEDYALDTDRRELRRGGTLVTIEPQVFDLLAYLIQHGDRVVTKDDLLAAVWNGRFVSESALTTRINAARTALGDDGKEQRLIRTLRGRGVRFVGDVRLPRDATSSASSQPPTLPDRPSIAVLPFANINGDPAQDYLIDGIAEDILSALSRVQWLFVIARQSSFSYKGRAVDVKQIGRELGVRYLVEGSIRTAGNRLRIGVQLIDAETGGHLWADRFDAALKDIFEVQDDVASCITGVIEPTLQTAERRRSARRPTSDLTAYDLLLRARAESYSWGRESITRSIDLLDEALKADASYALALATAAIGHLALDVGGWTNGSRESREQSVQLARRALQAGADDGVVLGDVAYVLGYFEPDIGPAVTLMKRSLEMDPNYAIGWTRSGWLQLWASHSEDAIAHFEKSQRLNPLRRGPSSFGIAVAHFFARRLEMSAVMLRLSVQENPNWPPSYRYLASCYAHLGRHHEARAIIEELTHITPNVLQSGEQWRVREDREFYLSGLRVAVSEFEQDKLPRDASIANSVRGEGKTARNAD